MRKQDDIRIVLGSKRFAGSANVFDELVNVFTGVFTDIVGVINGPSGPANSFNVFLWGCNLEPVFLGNLYFVFEFLCGKILCGGGI